MTELLMREAIKKGLEEAELNFSLTRAKMLNVESKIKSIKVTTSIIFSKSSWLPSTKSN